MTLHDFLRSKGIRIEHKQERDAGHIVSDKYLQKTGIRPRRIKIQTKKQEMQVCDYPPEFLEETVPFLIQNTDIAS